MNKLIEEYSRLRGFVTSTKLEAIDKAIKNRTRHVTMVLEDVKQAHNSSAVIRSCDCFGVQDLHVIENTHEFDVSREVVRGASKWVDVYRYRDQSNNTARCLTGLKSQGYKIVATSPHQDDFTIQELPIDQKVAVVIGSEGNGISDVVREYTDYYTIVPMHGFTESLNLSVTAAICLNQITSRLHRSELDWRLSDKEALEVQVNWIKKILRSDTIYDNQIDR